jgi:hypothetical protein
VSAVSFGDETSLLEAFPFFVKLLCNSPEEKEYLSLLILSQTSGCFWRIVFGDFKK